MESKTEELQSQQRVIHRSATACVTVLDGDIPERRDGRSRVTYWIHSNQIQTVAADTS